MSTQRFALYQPVFGNDNVPFGENVDVAAFTAPALRQKDAAAATPAARSKAAPKK